MRASMAGAIGMSGTGSGTDEGTTSMATSGGGTTTAASTGVGGESDSGATTSGTDDGGSTGCTPINLVADGGFEGGPAGAAWTASSSNFGTPICDLPTCPDFGGGGSGPAAGSYWAFIGGADFFVPSLPEIGEVSQSFVIPAGTATLQFDFELPTCDSLLDTFEVGLDGVPVFFRDGGAAECDAVGYTLQVVDVSAYADGEEHTLRFRGINEAFFFGPTNFMVDNVELISCP